MSLVLGLPGGRGPSLFSAEVGHSWDLQGGPLARPGPAGRVWLAGKVAEWVSDGGKWGKVLHELEQFFIFASSFPTNRLGDNDKSHPFSIE